MTAFTDERQIGRKRVRIPPALRADLTEDCCRDFLCDMMFEVARHGKVGTPEHNTWRGMKMRCNNPNHKHYSDYGGRGITVHRTWNEFTTFLKDMGNRPKGHTLDRINVNKGYGPGNCVWSDITTQNRNRRNVVNSFESMVLEADAALEFSSSRDAEAFITRTPELRRAAAFSWWKGSGNRWGIAINRGGPSFQFVRQEGDHFFAGDMLLETNESFMSEYKTRTFANPIMPSDRIWTFNKGETLVLTDLAPFAGRIHFSSILSPTNPGEGYAGKVIREITKLADKHGVTISLTPKPFGTVAGRLSKAKLVKWYRRHGWEFEDGKTFGPMIREPQ